MYKYNVVIKGKSIYIFIMYFVIILKFLEYVIKFDYSVCNQYEIYIYIIYYNIYVYVFKYM